MRKILTLWAAALLCLEVLAVPAQPGVFTYTQPDGSVVRLELHGDEFFSWTTLAGSPQVVVLGADGFWKHSVLDAATREAARRERRLANERRRQQKTVVPYSYEDNPLTHGERHIPVLLVAFQDVPFTIDNPLTKFSNLLNMQGYAYNNATGSVQDYYLENSGGQFKPVFDVYGPVTLPNDMKYYGEPVKDADGKIIKNDVRAAEALRDGCNLLDDVIDFSRYDYDNDGYVDMTLFYYAGYNTAEHGSENAIWPHQGNLGGENTFDGKRVRRYFCTSELKGSSGSTLCPIGTTCHEFGHSLGLPDFYDTDYEENGQSTAVSSFSIMCKGSYNNSGRTPPYFNSEERIILGWMRESDVQNLKPGAVSIGPVQNSIAYRSDTGIEGEYFLYECRIGTGWDAFLPGGLTVYHVDKSPLHLVGNTSAYSQWYDWERYNEINAYADHPCYYLIPAADPGNLRYEGSLASFVFPGTSNAGSFSPVDWEGENKTGLMLSGISYGNAQAECNVSFSHGKRISGQVYDLSGNGIPGVLVQLTPLSSSEQCAPESSSAHPRILDREILTDAEGNFRIDLSGFDDEKAHITLSKEGYRIQGEDVDLSARITLVEYRLSQRDQGDLWDYSYYDLSSGLKKWVTSQSKMASIRISASELPTGGGYLHSVSFYPRVEAEHYYVIVDQNGTLQYTEVHPPKYKAMCEYDLSDAKLYIAPGSDAHVGYAIENAVTPADYLFEATAAGKNAWLSSFSLGGGTTWTSSNDFGLYMDVTLVERIDTGEEPDITSLAQMGIPCIADPSCGNYTAGSSFPLRLDLPENCQGVSSVSWLFDGAAASGSVTLSAGSHVVTARVRWADGTQESLSLSLDVK